jgi:hypothetical protein
MPVSVRWKRCWKRRSESSPSNACAWISLIVTYELLDTATRGNKSRIEAVREQAEKQHAIVEARIEGLSALQREHHAEFQTLQGLVGVLQSETQRLDAAIGEVAAALVDHQGDNPRPFKWTHLAIAGLLLLTALGFALVKWVPAFAPASTEWRWPKTRPGSAKSAARWLSSPRAKRPARRPMPCSSAH